MEPYRNIFKEKTESELSLLYKQFLDFEKSGVISSDVELGKIRDQYCVWFNSGSPLVALERDLLHTVADKWYSEHKPDEDIQLGHDDFIAALQDNYEEALARGFDSIVLTIDTNVGNTYYIYDTPDGFQCDLWAYCFDDLEDIASQLYDEMHGNVTDIRIE